MDASSSPQRATKAISSGEPQISGLHCFHC